MERITYRKTLDVHKNGIQFMLQGFETADNMSRVIEISLMASGDAVDFPLENITAMMYITTPGESEPSINKCIIKDNKVVYDVLPIVEEGITTMQLKIIETSVEGATSVLASPKFAVEVSESDVGDESAEQTTTFTALEDAVAKAKETYDARLLRVEIDETCTFRAYYADGTVYETDALREYMLNGNALLSKSYAVGETKIRENEATDNSKYYSNVSRSSSEEAKIAGDEATRHLTETRKHSLYTAFSLDFDTGELKYISPSYNFDINEDSGELEAQGNAYTLDEALKAIVQKYTGIDYVVEEGEKTTGDGTPQRTYWRYKKWANGLAECWGEAYCSLSDTVEHAAFNNNFNMITTCGRRAYPIEFVEKPREQVNFVSHDTATSGVFAISCPEPIESDEESVTYVSGCNTTTQTGYYNAAVLTPDASAFTTLNLQIYYHIVGKWKE